MDINKEREAFEKLWTGGNGHLRFFKFDHDACKYLLNGVTDNLPKGDLLSASITLNTAWLFWLGAKKQATPEGFVLVANNSKTVVSIEKMVEQQVEASGITQDIFRLDGGRILEAIIEAQEQSYD